MRVVIAPDSFKSTMSAAEAARAIAEGWAEARPGDELILRPMADGGEGTLEALASLPSAGPSTGRWGARLGPEGAAAVFGPQKGGGGIVAEMDANLAAWARVLGGDPAAPGAGAAGGAGFALQRWGAETVSGAQAVAEAIGLPAALDGADLVITGEGAFDAQTASGKVVDVVRRLAGSVPVALIAGRMQAAFDGPAAELWALAGERALTDAAAVAREAARSLASG